MAVAGPPSRRHRGRRTSWAATVATSSSCCCPTCRRRSRAPRGRSSTRPGACGRCSWSRCRSGSAELWVRASVGVSLFPFDAADTQTLLKHADAAMYDAKAAGRDACRFYEPDARDSEERLELAARLRQAIKHGGLTLHYQPIVELTSGRMVAVEALARWNDAERGMIPPDEFIPLAESTGLIRPLSEWVIGEASRQATEWRPPATTSTCRSTSRPTPASSSAPRRSRTMIEAPGCEPSRITLEMTESATMVPRPGLKRGVGRALPRSAFSWPSTTSGPATRRSRGSASSPRAFSRSTARSFAACPTPAPRARSSTRSCTSPKGFGLLVVAEGVETEAQRDFLLGARLPATRRATCSRRRSEPRRDLRSWLSGAVSVGQTAELLA